MSIAWLSRLRLSVSLLRGEILITETELIKLVHLVSEFTAVVRSFWNRRKFRLSHSLVRAWSFS